jgi:hypothetical protein
LRSPKDVLFLHIRLFIIFWFKILSLMSMKSGIISVLLIIYSNISFIQSSKLYLSNYY